MHDANRNRHDLRRGMTGFKASQRVGARHIEKVDYAVQMENMRNRMNGMSKAKFKRKLLGDLKKAMQYCQFAIEELEDRNGN